MQLKIFIDRIKLKVFNEFCYRGSILLNYVLIVKELENYIKKLVCFLVSWRLRVGVEFLNILKERINIGVS